MFDFLEKTLSSKRLETYKKISNKCSSNRSAEQLYALNIQYSKELYVLLGGLEVVVRNNFNHACIKYMGKNDWISTDILLKKHKEQIDNAVRYVTKETKNNYIFDDIISQLNYGFWVNLCNSPYEKTLWNNALYKCFPYLGQKPNRGDIRKRLERTLQLRNKIAHLEPIIKNEELLIQEYRNIIELLYSMCPKTQEWFEEICDFENVWNARFSTKEIGK